MPRTSQKEARTTRSAKRRLKFGDGDGTNRSSSSSSSNNNSNDGDLKLFSVLIPVETVVPNALLLGSTGTPGRKKRRGQEGIAGLFSSPSKTTSTTEEIEAAMLVTPEKESEQKELIDRNSRIGSSTGTHVPEHIHKNLDYQRRGQAVLSETTRKAFELVEEYCGDKIPANFENDRRYGPLSGTCFEKRVIDAYDRGLIVASFSGVGDDPMRIVCTHCASMGHGRDDCPRLI